MNISNEYISLGVSIQDLFTDYTLTKEQFNQLNITKYSYEEFKSFQNLKNISYDDFLSKFEIIKTYGKVKYKIKVLKKENPSLVLEAHHVKDISVQYKEYNLKHGTSYKFRAEFIKNHKKEMDDRCIIVTPTEHFLIHLLAAKDLEGFYKETFYALALTSKISFRENIIQSLINLNKLREMAVELPKKVFEGRKAYTNGKITVYRKECPEGFWNGTAQKYKNHPKKTWWTNGKENILAESAPDDTFIKGVTSKERK